LKLRCEFCHDSQVDVDRAIVCLKPDTLAVAAALQRRPTTPFERLRKLENIEQAA